MRGQVVDFGWVTTPCHILRLPGKPALPLFISSSLRLRAGDERQAEGLGP